MTDTKRLARKVAIVTGGASGIGAETCRRLVADGAAVVIADIDAAGGARVATELTEAGGEALFRRVDLQDRAQIEGLVEAALRAFGGLDILVNNAVAVPPGDRSVAEMDLDAWDMALRVNLTAPMYASKLAIPHMIARGGGSIVHVSSAAALVSEDTRSAYATTKSGLLALSRSIAVQYGKSGIRSNAIAPGLILTPAAEAAFTPDQRAMFVQHHMTPRLGLPLDIAASIVFLCTDDAAFITGHVLVVDGGFTAAGSMVPELRRQRG